MRLLNVPVVITLVVSVCTFASERVAQAQVPFEKGEWPQWRGPHRDGHGLGTGLLKKWPSESPPVVAWKVATVGVGYSSIAVKDGRIVTQGDLHGVEHVICLDARTGKRLWAVQPAPVAAKLSERIAGEIKRHDKNGDGTLDDLETTGLRDALRYDRSVEGDAAGIATTRANRLLRKLDKNNDGKIDEAEAGGDFAREIDRIDQEDRSADTDAVAKARAAALLKRLDGDDDGHIDRKESRGSSIERPFRQIDRKSGAKKERDGRLSPDELLSYLRDREKGRDGVLTRDELRAHFQKRYSGRDGLLTADELKGFYGGYRNGQGDGPRGTPAIDGDRVYCEGGFGDVTCLDLATGKTIWHRNLTEDFGGGRPGWGYSESPLVVEDLVVVTPGGRKGTLLALDKKTGEPRWQSEGTKQGAQYSSPIVAEIAGVRQVVQFARKSAFGVSLEKGKLLWEYGGANNGTANCTTPIVYKDHVFAASAYGTGGGLARISSADGGMKATQVYFEKKMANHHGGIVRVGEHMYGFGNGGLICMEVLSGKIAWTNRSVGKGSLIHVDGMLYCLGERHQMALVEASPEEYRERGRFGVKNLGRPSWAHPVVAGGRLYVRNQGELTAYDVRGAD